MGTGFNISIVQFTKFHVLKWPPVEKVREVMLTRALLPFLPAFSCRVITLAGASLQPAIFTLVGLKAHQY